MSVYRSCPVCGSSVKPLKLLMTSGIMTSKSLFCVTCGAKIAEAKAWRVYSGVGVVGFALSMILMRYFLPQQVGIGSELLIGFLIVLLGLLAFLVLVYYTFPLAALIGQEDGEGALNDCVEKTASVPFRPPRLGMVLFAIPSIIFSVAGFILGAIVPAICSFVAGVWVGTGIEMRRSHWIVVIILLSVGIVGVIRKFSDL